MAIFFKFEGFKPEDLGRIEERLEALRQEIVDAVQRNIRVESIITGEDRQPSQSALEASKSLSRDPGVTLKGPRVTPTPANPDIPRPSWEEKRRLA